ncbi:amino acid permease C-terminal domain-containing protein [Nocardia albiluteola]|nr:amino acid permease C-terminal domain-containing protein [Nocardia albiluteola]
MTELTWVTWLRFVIWLVLGLALYWGFGYRNSTLNRPQAESAA